MMLAAREGLHFIVRLHPCNADKSTVLLRRAGGASRRIAHDFRPRRVADLNIRLGWRQLRVDAQAESFSSHAEDPPLVGRLVTDMVWHATGSFLTRSEREVTIFPVFVPWSVLVLFGAWQIVNLGVVSV